VDVAAEIDAPAEVVWALLADTSRWADWGPSVRAVESPARLVTPGLRGRVRTAAGVRVRFEITRVEPGRAWDWRVAGIAATGHRVEPLGPARCRAVFVVPAWAAPYGLVCAVALRRLSRLATGQAP
jgi:uncharacterized protein YndB with AHSA1/START domain